MEPTDAVAEALLGHADIADALKLSDEARWNQTAADWAVFIDHGESYGLRADGRLVASAAILPFSGGFGWISMVLVTAEWRRRGLASRLMGRCIDALRARGAASLLDATPEGAPVYGRLGFRSCSRMARWRGGRGAASLDVFSHSPPIMTDRPRLFARDAQVFGGDRRFLLEDFFRRPGTVFLGDDADFVLLRQGHRATQIGPLIAGTDTVGRDLLEAALAMAVGPVIIDVLDAGAALHPVLKKHGFEAFRSFERMVLDRPDLPGQSSALMAAAGPEFG